MNISGKRTYIVAVAAIAYAIGGVISGYLDTNTAIQVVLAALGGVGLRLGITKDGS